MQITRSVTLASELEEERKRRRNALKYHHVPWKTMRHVAFAVILFDMEKIFLIVCTVVVGKYIQTVLSVASSTTKLTENHFSVHSVERIGDRMDLRF